MQSWSKSKFESYTTTKIINMKERIELLKEFDKWMYELSVKNGITKL